MLEMITAVVRDLLIFVVMMFVLLIVLLIVVSTLPDNNPLKRILAALSYRVGATLGAGVMAIPIEPIPRHRRALRHRHSTFPAVALGHVHQGRLSYNEVVSAGRAEPCKIIVYDRCRFSL
jgi:hypothetical protein